MPLFPSGTIVHWKSLIVTGIISLPLVLFYYRYISRAASVLHKLKHNKELTPKENALIGNVSETPRR